MNTYKGGGDFFKNVLKPMVNNFLTKQFLPLGGLYFSKYAFFKYGEMFPYLTGPTQDTTQEGLKDTAKKLRPEFNGAVSDVLCQLKDFKDELVEDDLPVVLGQLENSLENQADSLVKKIPEVGDHLNNMTGEILDNNASRVKKLMQEGTDSVVRGAFMAPVSIVKNITDQSPDELRLRKKHFDKNDKTFDVHDIQKVGNVGMIVNAIERATGKQNGVKKKKKKE